jgi:hypothetical protein
MKDTFQFLWAVIRFIPAVFYVVFVGILFYAYIRLIHPFFDKVSAKDVSGYCDHFDKF